MTLNLNNSKRHTVLGNLPKTVDADEAAASSLVNRLAVTPASDPRRQDLRADAIVAWIPLAHRLAGRYVTDRERGDDVRQTAVVGLIKAVDGFDPRCGTDFVAYAVPTIVGEMKRYFRDRTWALRPPRPMQDLYLRVNGARTRLTQQLMRQPTPADVAAELGVAIDQVLEALECFHARRAASLCTPLSTEGSGQELGDTVGGEDDGYRATEDRVDLHRALTCLAERERRVITLYFFGNQSQAEIARELGLSQMHISRLIRQSLRKLHDVLRSAPC